MRALETRLVPSEAFIYLGTSVKPLDDKPLDLDEIERVLTREDLDLETNVLLIGIFNKLIKSADSEIALFAAESINIIVNRYNKKIEALKQGLKKGEDAAVLRELARLFFEFSQIHPASIKKFYLKESYSCLHRIEKMKRLTRRDAGLVIQVLLALGLPGQARLVIDQFQEKDDPFLLLLEAEVEFQRKNFLEVLHICTRLFAFEDRLDEKGKAVLAYWLGD